ncbi:sce7725 family protein [Pseudomonas aeruginosa]|uniref:Sce7725 family protein n=1 Tax=Pseudomonas aeruginosa TaxID=287 RepID=A0A5E5R234_PSEAI|nr:sce7725 family protein [Pseudomonas aeruginosa]MBG5708991.1 sce7725 family protein [Pseudomonas aeruginosa]MBR7546643.1 sce7725 family protein [Pseudomonas aeruginosa]MBV6122928.1 sce7725 family protein [Pseudomonas aeruginosa]MBV6135155.1 sce7725 family protein [Pseudomonas aeruginosa]QCJ32972.1 sce7725 family protein [Pseudomonas aeruginosa]
MYYPILRGKRHELNAVVELASRPVANRFRPLLEPVNNNIAELASCIGSLYGRGISPYVVINPGLGDYQGRGANVAAALHLNNLSSGKFIPCVKIIDSFDANAIGLLQSIPGAAAYMVSDISPAMLPALANADCNFVNILKVDGAVLNSVPRVVCYLDSFARQRRNADYQAVSFYSNLHFNYRNNPNSIGVGDFTVMGEEYSEAGGPAYVVAIHMSHVQNQPVGSIYVNHFCSTMQPGSPANPGGKFLEALDNLIAFDRGNPGHFYNSWGLAQFYGYHADRHYPGLGVVKELSVEHHMETVCSFI